MAEQALAFPVPQRGASLMVALRPPNGTLLIIGSGPLAAARAFAALEAEFQVVVFAKEGLQKACDELQWRAQQGQLSIFDLGALSAASTTAHADIELANLECYLRELECRTRKSAEQIYQLCRRYNILVNVTDIPDLCDFTFSSTHRIADPSTSAATSLQIGVTTNGRGCRLAGRIRRDIVARLPREVAGAVQKVGRLRDVVKKADTAMLKNAQGFEGLNEDGALPTPNRPVPMRDAHESEAEAARRRMKWVAQISEYWPYGKLAELSEDDIGKLLDGDTQLGTLSSSVNESDPSPTNSDSLHFLSLPSHLIPPVQKGRIFLVGSGPGHPALLTRATHTLITEKAQLVLSDKLVPEAVLALIPQTVQVQIARKFPGNAEEAQRELMEAAVEAAQRGLCVVRLKQGDPVVYGRAGEEVLYFRAHGFEPVVVPGVSSAIAAPTLAGIPVTQRGVAESLVISTGVGRKGREVRLPGYERARTLVVLMGVARLAHVVAALVEERTSARDGPAYPTHTPVAVVERASMHDQRVVESTLDNILQAMESAGEQRPPGLLVVGWAVLALHGKGDTAVLDEDGEAIDGERVARWLEDKVAWKVSEGLGKGWEEL